MQKVCSIPSTGINIAHLEYFSQCELFELLQIRLKQATINLCCSHSIQCYRLSVRWMSELCACKSTSSSGCIPSLLSMIEI